MIDAELKSRVEKIKEKIPASEWKYYHLQSVENFIYHLNNFKNQRTVDRVAQKLFSYIEQLQEKIEESLSVRQKSKNLFPLIWDIAEDYKIELGFIHKPNPILTIALLIPLFFILNSALSVQLSAVICFVIAVGYIAYGWWKVKSKRVYLY